MSELQHIWTGRRFALGILIALTLGLSARAHAQVELDRSPEKTSLREAPLTELYGKRAGSILVIQAKKGGSANTKNALATGDLSTAQALADAAAGIFGRRQANSPIKYQPFIEALAVTGLDREVGRFLKNLSPALQDRFYAGELSPKQIFVASAQARLSWEQSGRAVNFTAVKSRLQRDGQGEALARAIDAMSTRNRSRLERGKMPGAELSRHIKEVKDRTPDVVIVGAGMAGVTAAHELRKQGLHVVILEAADRAGGRSYTDRSKLGLPIDIGATWLHNSGENALTPIARNLGLTIVIDSKPNQKIFDGKTLRSSKKFDAIVDSKYQRIESAGLRGIDVRATSVAPTQRGKMDKVANRYAAGLMVGVDSLAEASTKDLAHTGHEVNDAFVTQGLGSIAEAFTHGLEVKKGSPVSSVTTVGDHVDVVANGKTYTAKQVLVTTSPGVLAAGKIQFTPSLSGEKKAALKDIKMAHFTKVFASYKEGALASIPANSHIIDASNPKAPIEFVVRPFGADVVIVMSGGAEARKFETWGEKKSVAHMVKRLDTILGKPLSKNFHAGAMTGFNSDPNTLGTWGYARPGGYHGRKALAKPIDGKIFFAGEAITHADWTMTLTGAHLSGKEVVSKMSKARASKVRISSKSSPRTAGRLLFRTAKPPSRFRRSGSASLRTRPPPKAKVAVGVRARAVR